MTLHDDAEASRPTGSTPVYRSDPGAAKFFVGLALLLVTIGFVAAYFRQSPILAPELPESHFGPTGAGAGLSAPMPFAERLWRSLPIIGGFLLLASVWHRVAGTSVSQQILNGTRLVLSCWMQLGIINLLIAPPTAELTLINYRKMEPQAGGMARVDAAKAFVYGFQYLAAGLGGIAVSWLITARPRQPLPAPAQTLPATNAPVAESPRPPTETGFCPYCASLVYAQDGRCLTCGGAVHA